MQPSGLRKNRNNDNGFHKLVESVMANGKAALYIEFADDFLKQLGYTEHGPRHVRIVASSAYKILKKLGFDEKEACLAGLAGLLHDTGNLLGRSEHQRTGALLAKEIMEELGYPLRDIVTVMTAIMVHDDSEGVIPHPVAGALIIADKADVHRSRVRKVNDIKGDIHDRVNYAATESDLSVDSESRLIKLNLVIDTRISHVIDYFEIFLTRMKGCREAASRLEAEFQLFINGTRMA
ncbi:MAG: hypothetical protein M0033_12765 [Nitrospiraceae bacterium]|nr:hypothetical protein [Nitrospiraceae bacterium]